jgi:hypothetical protein
MTVAAVGGLSGGVVRYLQFLGLERRGGFGRLRAHQDLCAVDPYEGWPVPNQSNNFVLNYYRCVQMQDANLAGGETPDIPYRWIDWFVAGMAHRLCRPYATIELEKLRKADAVEAWTVAATQDTENVVVTLSPNISAYYRR